MIVPEGYEKLAVIGIAYKGPYAANAPYKLLNAVYCEGSTFVALKDNPVKPPVADGVNWQYLAKGFLDGMLSAIDAIDKSGLIGTAGAAVDAQALLDVIADKVATKLLLKNQVVNSLLATIPGNALDATQGKALSDRIDQVNSDFVIYKNDDLKTGSISSKPSAIITSLTIPAGLYLIGYCGRAWVAAAGSTETFQLGVLSDGVDVSGIHQFDSEAEIIVTTGTGLPREYYSIGIWAVKLSK